MTTTVSSATRTVGNFIAGQERPATGGDEFDKLDPATGVLQSRVARSRREDVAAAVRAPRARFSRPGRPARSPSAAPSFGGLPSCWNATSMDWPPW